jgi:hypothetical protein
MYATDVTFIHASGRGVTLGWPDFFFYLCFQFFIFLLTEQRVTAVERGRTSCCRSSHSPDCVSEGCCSVASKQQGNCTSAWKVEEESQNMNFLEFSFSNDMWTSMDNGKQCNQNLGNSLCLTSNHGLWRKEKALTIVLRISNNFKSIDWIKENKLNHFNLALKY